MNLKKTNTARSHDAGEGYNAALAKEQNLLGTKLQLARKALGLTAEEVTAELLRNGIEVHSSVVSKWELGRVVPNSYQLLGLCRVLQIEEPVGYFTGCQELSDAGLRKVANYRQDLIASGRYRPQPARGEILYMEMPVSMLAVSAGRGNFLADENFEMMSFPTGSVPAGADFGVRVAGDSMEPVYTDGQIVWVHQCSELRSGEVGIFMLDGEGYMKMFRREEGESAQPQLVSYNRRYDPIVISPERELKIVGRVL